MESRHAIGIGGVRLGQDLDRHLAIELGIAGPIHFTHAAGAEKADYFMTAENRSGGQAQNQLNRMRKDSTGSRCIAA